MVPQYYHSGPAAHIHPAEAAAGRNLGQQARHSLAVQGILLLFVELDIVLDQQLVDYMAYSHLAVGQGRREYFVGAVGIALAVHVTGIGHNQVAVDSDIADYADHKGPVGVWDRRKYCFVRQWCGVAVQSYRMRWRHAQMASDPTYLDIPGRSLGQSNLGCR